MQVRVSWPPFPFPSILWRWSCSVMSDPQRPHGLQPTRLLRPWDFPGKSTVCPRSHQRKESESFWGKFWLSRERWVDSASLRPTLLPMPLLLLWMWTQYLEIQRPCCDTKRKLSSVNGEEKGSGPLMAWLSYCLVLEYLPLNFLSCTKQQHQNHYYIMAVAFFSFTSHQLFCNCCSFSAAFITMSISLHLKHSFFGIHDATLLDFLIPSCLPHFSSVLDGRVWQDLMAPSFIHC